MMAAIGAFAIGNADATAASEGLFLAFWAGWVSSCAAALAPRSARSLSLACGLLVLAAWVLPAGPTRSAAMAALLLALLLLTAWLRWRQTEPPTFRHYLPLALGLQGIFESRAFVAVPDHPLTLAFALGPALLAALGAALLSRFWSPSAILLAGMAVATLEGGFSFEGGALLLVVGAGALAAREIRSSATGDTQGLSFREQLGYGGKTPAIALGLLLAIGLAFGPVQRSAGFLLLVLAAVMVWPASGRSRVLGMGAATFVLFALLLGADHVPVAPLNPPLAVLAGFAPVALLLPREMLGLDRRLALALALGWIGSTWAPGNLGLATLAVLVALGSSPSRTGWRLGWIAAGLSGAALAAAYPWLRAEPLLAALEVLGLDASWGTAAAALGLALALSLVARSTLALRVASRPMVLLLLPPLLLFAPGLRHAPERLLDAEPEVLRPGRPRWQADLVPARGVGDLSLVSNLAYGSDLPAGQPVAVVRFDHEDGSSTERLLLAGVHTADWAASRADVARSRNSSAPAAWLSTVAPGGGFFAQRFRASFSPSSSSPVLRVEVMRRRDLPEETTLQMLAVEVRP